MTRSEYEGCLDALAAQAKRQIDESTAMLAEIERLRSTPIADDVPSRAQTVTDERDGVRVRSRRSGAHAALAGIGRAS